MEEYEREEEKLFELGVKYAHKGMYAIQVQHTI
jgi:hypothetical protein